MKISTLFAGCVLIAAVSMPAVAQQSVYTAELLGSNEVPPNDSPGTSTATVTVDSGQGTMRVHETFSGLLAPTIISHIHCCTDLPNSGTVSPATTVPTFPDFPVGVTAGIYDRTFNMLDASSYNPTFVASNGGTPQSAFNALIDGFNSGTAYANIHTEMFPAGEIRGFLAPIPEPETYAMLLAGLAVVSMMRRYRRLIPCEEAVSG